jgi:CheY-like chemotaxis protein
MSGDLVSLRVLAVSAAGTNQDLLRQGAALASLPLELAEAATAAKAAALLSNAEFDLVLLDSVGDADQVAVAKAARACAKPPLMVLVGGGAAEGGADAIASKPRNIEDARSLLDSCVRAKIPGRVLIVDDSPTMRSIVRKILGASRFPLRTQEVDNGAAALAYVRSGGIDVVFLDYNMPGLDGLTTLVELKRACPEVTVALMTSTHDKAVAQRAMEAGAAAFLKKPFYPADVDAIMYRRCGLMPLKT